jgi:hypothetical protein
MNSIVKHFLNFTAILILCSFVSCSKNTAASGSNNSTGPTGPTGTIPSNIVDISSNSSTTSLTLNPYPGFPTLPMLIPVNGSGYYYIAIGGSDTLTFQIDADSSAGGDADISSQTSDNSPNQFTSGDTLEFLVTFAKFINSIGDSAGAYFTKDLAYGYTITSSDTLNFSNAYTVGQIYTSGLSTSSYNLLNSEGYLAFKLKNNLGNRYGWMRVASDPAGGNLFSVFEIAYNKNYNVTIAIGEYQ